MRIFILTLLTFGILLQCCCGQEEEKPNYTIEIWRENLTSTSDRLLSYLFQLDKSPEAAAQLVPELNALLSHKNETVRLFAVRALRKTGPDAVPAVDSLIQMLNDPDYTFRIEVMETLKSIGLAAVPKLTAALSSESPKIKSHSLSVLNRLTQVEANVLERLEKEQDTQIRVCVAQAWTRHEKYGVAKLSLLCQDEDISVAVAGIESLKYNYSDTQLAISSLRKCLPNQDTWSVAVAALLTFGVEAQVALPDILASFHTTTVCEFPKDPNEELLYEALDHIGPANIDDLQKLIALLSHSKPIVRLKAAELIGQMGPAAKSAAATLATTFDTCQHKRELPTRPALLTPEEAQAGVDFQDELLFAIQCQAAEAFWMVTQDTLAYARMLELILEEPEKNFSFPQTQVVLFGQPDIAILGRFLHHENLVIRSNIAHAFRSLPTSLLNLNDLKRLREISNPRSTFYFDVSHQLDQATESEIVAWLTEDFERNSISLQDVVSFLRTAKIRVPYFDAHIRDQLNSRSLGPKTDALIYSVLFADSDKESTNLVLDTVRKDWDLRPTALRLLLHRTDPSPGVIEFAERSLNSTSHGVVSNSLALLIKTAAANPSLISKLEARLDKFRRSKSPWRYDLAIYALAYLTRDKTIIATGSSPLSQLDETTCYAIFGLISRLNDDGDFFLDNIQSYLEDATNRKSDRTERTRNALRLLGSLPSNNAKELLRQYSLDRDWQIRMLATSILNDLDAGRILPYEYDVY